MKKRAASKANTKKRKSTHKSNSKKKVSTKTLKSSESKKLAQKNNFKIKDGVVDYTNVKIPQWVSTFKVHAVKQKGGSQCGHVFFLGSEDQNKLESILLDQAPSWQYDELVKSKKDLLYFTGQYGPVWILKFKLNSSSLPLGTFPDSSYTKMRESFGSLVLQFRSLGLKEVQIEFVSSTYEQELGALVGLELAAYNFKSTVLGKLSDDLPQVYLIRSNSKVNNQVIKDAQDISTSTNLARHLVNLPPNFLNPESYSKYIQNLFKNFKNIQIEIWNENKLKKENMGLHLAVGQGAKHAPCLVRIKYRPKSKKSKNQKPYAFVGKGITFDTGGLDLKPSSAMRLMKKDMGGSATVLGLAYWVANSNVEQACDFYLALAENSVSSRSFRPSDVFVSRNGIQVEIDNTDAEGRLVLADALDVAVTQKNMDEPEFVIDVSTLTGAIKVALGADVAGLFCNHDELAQKIFEAGNKTGDYSWRMPLVQKYNSGMSSHFADIVNSVNGFGGAITAALFLEKFVKNKPWAHLDIYAWNDKATGSLGFSGGNGQAVQALIEFIKTQAGYISR